MFPRNLQLLVIGCGTAGYHNTRRLAQTAGVAPRTAHVTFVDRATIREQFNAWTCPEYAGHDGRAKEARLAELARAWFGPEVRIETAHGNAEALDYAGLLRPPPGQRITKTCALLGLDCWEARIAVVRALRRAGSVTAGDVLVIQTSFDRGEAQVTVLGNDWDCPCVVCSLATLPQTQPCVVLRKAAADGGESLRGDLRREARLAAAEVRRVVLADLSGNARHRNVKVNLLLQQNGPTLRVAHPLRHTPGCWGPHDPARRPLTLEEIFQ